jgi:uncharacterized membrane protein
MPKARLVILLRLALLVAIVASAALLIEYENAGDPAFCGAGSGCVEVRRSVYSKIGSVSLPVIGLGAFTALFGLVLAARTKSHHALVAGISAVGAFLAVVLIVLQAAVIGAFCKWCVAVDASAIVAAVAAIFIYRDASARPEAEAAYAEIGKDPSILTTWAIAALLACGLPFLWARFPVVPPLQPELSAVAARGKINLVQFTDFECPYCRKLHPLIDRMRAEAPAEVHFVRLMMPLEGHVGAMPAALAYACVPDDLKDAFAAKL